MVAAGLWARAHGAQIWSLASKVMTKSMAKEKVRERDFKRACRWHFQEREISRGCPSI